MNRLSASWIVTYLGKATSHYGRFSCNVISLLYGIEPKDDHTFQFNQFAWDGHNNLYICDRYKYRILRYQMDTGVVSSFVGRGKRGYQDGILSEASFYELNSITIDKNGDIYITDHCSIRKINVAEQRVETIAGSHMGYQDGECKDAYFNTIIGIAIDDHGTLFVCDKNNSCIRQIKNGVVSTVTGHSEGGTLSEFKLFAPHCVVVDIDGSLLVLDGTGAIWRIDISRNLMCRERIEGIDNPQEHGTIPGTLTKDVKGDIYVEIDHSIYRLQRLWKYERFLWIGKLKNDVRDCHLAMLPKEIIQVISFHLMQATRLDPAVHNKWVWLYH